MRMNPRAPVPQNRRLLDRDPRRTSSFCNSIVGKRSWRFDSYVKISVGTRGIGRYCVSAQQGKKPR